MPLTMETACRKACSLHGPSAQQGLHPPSIARWLGLHREPILRAFSRKTSVSPFWDFPKHPKRDLCTMLQERFGPMILPLLGRVALWDCLFGAEAPCLLQPPPEIIRLFSPSPFSSRACESAERLDGVSLPPIVELC